MPLYPTVQAFSKCQPPLKPFSDPPILSRFPLLSVVLYISIISIFLITMITTYSCFSDLLVYLLYQHEGRDCVYALHPMLSPVSGTWQELNKTFV